MTEMFVGTKEDRKNCTCNYHRNLREKNNMAKNKKLKKPTPPSDRLIKEGSQPRIELRNFLTTDDGIELMIGLISIPVVIGLFIAAVPWVLNGIGWVFNIFLDYWAWVNTFF